MPEHIKFILRHAALGGVAAIGFVGLLLGLNVGNLWHLVTHAKGGVLAAFVMTAFFWITFGSVQIGIRIMSMGGEGRGGGTRAPRRAAPRLPVGARAVTGTTRP